MGTAARPNVVLIMVDQWRGDCLGVEGHPVVRTPFLDRLATRGVRFSRAYTATPSCVAARASLMTGQRPFRHGRVGYADHVPWDYPVTLAGEFTAAGYQTQAVGKMHFFPERTQLGFQNVVLHSPGGIIRSARQRGMDPDYVDDYLPWLRRELGRDATFYDTGLDSNSYVARPWDKPEHTHPTNWVASQAIDFLRRRDPRKPFLLHVSINAPHPPFDPAGWAFDQYRDTVMPDPVFGDWVDDLAEFAQPADPTAQVAGPLPSDVLQRAKAGYYGHMTHIDQQVNRVLEALDQHGVGKDTIVCFTSDHGELLGDHGCHRKSMHLEGSARIPLLMAGPGIEKGVVRDDLIELGDLMPTLLELAGVPIPPTVDGVSARRLLSGDVSGTPWRELLHGEHTLFGQSLQWLTDSRHKYVWFSGSGVEHLFDLADDPHECHDLVRAGTHDDVLAGFRSALVEQLRNREEGFVADNGLVTGRPVSPVLSHLRASAV